MDYLRQSITKLVNSQNNNTPNESPYQTEVTEYMSAE